MEEFWLLLLNQIFLSVVLYSKEETNLSCGNEGFVLLGVKCCQRGQLSEELQRVDLDKASVPVSILQ